MSRRNAGPIAGSPAALALSLTLCALCVLLTTVPAASQQTTSWSTVNLWEKWPPGESGLETQGKWAPDSVDTEGSQFYGVHGALLYDPTSGDAKLMVLNSELLAYNLAEPDSFYLVDLNGTPGQPQFPPNGHQPFCSGYVPLPDDTGRLLIVGGRLNEVFADSIPITTGWASILDPRGEITFSSWAETDSLPYDSGGLNTNDRLPNCPTSVNNMSRYYPTCISTEDGRILTAAGDYWDDCDGEGDYNGANDDAAFEILKSKKWVLYDPDAAAGSKWATQGTGGFYSPWGEQEMVNYPHLRVTPHGLFYAGNDRPIFNTGAQPSYLWPFPWSGASGPVAVADYKDENRHRSSCVVLTLDARTDSVSVLLTGGGADGAKHADSEICTYYVDVNSITSDIGSSGWSTIAMNSTVGRSDGNAVLLPDGTALSIGGQEDDDVQNLSVERFELTAHNPPAGTWTSVASLNAPRGHHSFALLLPDGRLFVTGHEVTVNGSPVRRPNYQIYYPPYLFTSSGWATRDAIDTHAQTVNYGLPFELTVLDDAAADVDEVVLMRPSCVTHGTDFSQTRILLSHAVDPQDASRLIVSGPKSERYGPEGYYMLFVLDDGVPSEAVWVMVERAASDAFTVSNGETVRWGADVWLDRDVKVEPGGRLEILPGTTVHAAPNPVSTPNLGDSAIRVEIVVEGQIVADGTSSAPIVFRADDPEPADDAWDGIEFNVAGTYVPAYGQLGALEPLSSFSHVTIQDARYGLQITNLVAPSLDSLAFENIRSGPSIPERHVFLDKSDVFIPFGTWWYDPVNDEDVVVPPSGRWNLLGGTNVVATNTVTTSLNTPIGDSTKVNLVVQGALFTTGSAASGDSVVFRPVTRDDATGDDWGGLWIENNYKSDIDYADIGHAANPVFFFYPDSSTALRHSRVHHFADLGVWVYKSKAGGGLLKRNLVERGALLGLALGNAGVFLDRADQMTLISNEIDMTASAELSASGNHYALEIYMGKIFCQNPAPQARTVTIDSTTVVGNGQSDTGDRSGIFCNWICGSSTRAMNVTESDIQGWNHSGLRFFQCGDVDVSCNRVEASKRAVHFSRNNDATGTSVTFKTNRFEGEPSARHAVVQTDNALKIDLGPSGLKKGDNRLFGLLTPPLYWMYEDDPTDANVVDAQNNSWWKDGSLETSVFSPLLSTEFTGAVKVDTTGFYLTDAANGCPACVPGCGQQTGAQASLQEAEAPGRTHSQSQPLEPVIVPERSSLEPPWPNPALRSVAVSFGVGRTNGGGHRLVVYDVTGRRVRTILEADLAPGTYRRSWDGRDGRGVVVSSGVYFVRLTGPGFNATRKILLRE